MSHITVIMNPGSVKNFLFSMLARPASIQRLPAALPPGVQRPGHEADHSPPASVEVKNFDCRVIHPGYILGLIFNP
jgi:hypothetical protein